jgi:predicted permease
MLRANMTTLLRDVHSALRMARKNAGFATVAILTLALGIGATTAIFTLIEQVMLRPLPVVQPDRLWRVGDAVRCCNSTGYAQNGWSFFPAEAYRVFRANTPAFEELAPGGGGVSLMGENYTDALRLLLFAAVCVLLVACANVANLLLARGLRNRDQTSLRPALGASRARLVRMALAESLTLAGFGSAAGIVVAYAGTTLVLRLAFGRGGTWVPVSAAPSSTVLLFALGVSVVTAVVFGIAPAWMAVHADPIEALRGANRSVGGNRHWAQKGLVIVQAAGSIVLLSAAAMLGQSFHNLNHQDFGFDLNGRYLIKINTRLSRYTQEQMVPVFREIEDRMRAIPGVRMVSAALYAPMSQLNWRHDVRIVGKPEPGPNDDLSSAWTRVVPGWFETVGNRIVLGRPITSDDDADARPVAVVNDAFVRKFFSGKNPIGQHFGPASQKKAGVYEIVGVASDVRFFADVRPVPPMYFVPLAQSTHFDDPTLETREAWSHYPYNIVIWAPGNPRDLAMQVTKRAQ